MEYSFRPQWRTWTFNSYRHRHCSRCGFYRHQHGQCPAIHKQCYKCKHFGHFARQCWTKTKYQQCETTTQHSKIKSRHKKERDNRRLQQYFETKTLWRELPFSTIRNNALLQFLNPTCAVKIELNTVRNKLKSQKANHMKETDEIKHQVMTLKCANDILRKELDTLREESTSKNLNLETVKKQSDKIRHLESERKQDLSLIQSMSQQYTTVAVEKEKLLIQCDEHLKTIQNLKEQLNNVFEQNNYQDDMNRRNNRYRNNHYRGRFK